MFSILCFAECDDNTGRGHIGSCRLCSGLLSVADGRSVRNQHSHYATVSKLSIMIMIMILFITSIQTKLITTTICHFDICRGVFGILLTGLCILWCSASASKLFVTAYSMDHQQILIAYPCALLYGVFALITIF